MVKPATAAAGPPQRLGPVGAVHDQLGHQRVVVRGDGRPGGVPGVHPHAVAGRLHPLGDRAGAGQEPFGVLGVDPQLDGVTGRVQRRLVEAGVLAGRDPQLGLDQVDARAPPR